MGRQCAVPRQNAIDVLLRYMSYFSNPSMPPYSSEVWKDLSKECDGAWSHLSWWVNVTEDRRKILTQARQAAGVNATEIVKETITKSSSCAECDFSFHRSDSEGEMGESTFHLVLTQEKWNKIKPVDCDHDHEKRQSHTLRAGFWSNEIADEFYKQHGLPCAYSFRRAEINISLRRKYYLKIDGKCRSKKCGNYFHGYLDVEPTLVDKRIVIRVRTRNTSREVHEDVRRYLNAAKRREFGKQSHAEGATNMLKRLRRENMERGDTEGPNFPRADVLRHAQYEYVDRQLGIRTTNDDLVQKIYQLQFEKPFLGSINAVGYNPVYIFYGLPLQNTLFKNYNKIMGDRSIVCIDGTGSLVRKVVRELGLQSGHIFLHTIVINFDNKIGSVFQMLSESQDAETFTFWLKRWLNIVNVKPKQSITDYSRALLTGTSKAFNNMTIKDYLNVYFSFLRDGDVSILNTISTFLRIDVAHLIHIICRWDSTKAIQRHQVRDFFIRCVAMMVDCQHLSEFNEIFSLTCAVGLNCYDDTFINWRSVITVSQARERLEYFMSNRNVLIENEFSKTHDIEEQDNICFEDDPDGPSSIKNHIKKLVTKATSVVHKGAKLNSFYVPRFIEQLIRIGNEFILWTAVGVPFFVGHASSSYNEKSFQDLKHKVLKPYSRRINLEKFLRIHILDLIGGTKDVSDKLIRFTVQGKTVPAVEWKTQHSKETRLNDGIFNNPVEMNSMNFLDDGGDELSGSIIDDSDLMSQENWRGKVEPGLFDALPHASSPDEAENVSSRRLCTAYKDDHRADEEKEIHADYVGESVVGYFCSGCDQFIKLGMLSSHVCKTE